MSLFLINMLPLLPLDGGHILGRRHRVGAQGLGEAAAQGRIRARSTWRP